MPTKEEINRQIAAYPNPYFFWTGKEVRALPAIIDTGEHIKALTSGMLNGKTWLVVCTDRRLIFLNRGMLWGTEQVQMPLDRVQSIDHEFSWFFGSIRVFDGVNVFGIRMIIKSAILPFVKATEETMYAYRQGQTRPATSNASTDIASQLAKLADLKEKGYLTDAEFQAQKHKLLGS